MNITHLNELAMIFRDAIENLSRNGVFIHIGLKRYPRGSCGVVSEFLGRYLLEHGIQSYYICGFKSNASHAWLAVNDYIIDITGDQFDYCNEKIYIGDISLERLGFIAEENDVRKVLINSFDSYLVKKPMYHDYDLILGYISSNKY